VLVLSPLLVPLATALLTALLYRQPVRVRRAVSLAGALLLALCAGVLLVAVEQTGRISLALGGWPLPYAIEFAADRLSAALVLITAVLGVAVLLHQTSRADSAPETPILHPLLHGLLAAVGAAFVTADLFNLYVWFELMLIATLGLLVHGGEPRQMQAAFIYLALNLVGTLLLLIAVALLYGATGHLNFSALRQAAQRPDLAAVLPVYVSLLGLALLLKAGAFPLFFWLPASYHTLPAPVLALIGGLLTKVGVYALLRLLGEVFTAAPAVLYEALGGIALLTMVTGGLGAVYHWDLRRILAFHIVSQIGYLLLGIALASPAGAAATLFFTLHNIVAKASLFLIAGLIWALAGHHDLRRIGGLYTARPGLALLFLIAALALVGLPPLSGFWGKYLLVRESFAQERWLWGGMALAVGLLTLYSMLKIGLEAFWKPHPAGHAIVPVAGLGPAYGAVILLTALILLMGLLPEPFIHYAEAAAASLGRGGSTP
jgi:multicomponent Na+:H+ antiporter subunit D